MRLTEVRDQRVQIDQVFLARLHARDDVVDGEPADMVLRHGGTFVHTPELLCRLMYSPHARHGTIRMIVVAVVQYVHRIILLFVVTGVFKWLFTYAEITRLIA